MVSLTRRRLPRIPSMIVLSARLPSVGVTSVAAASISTTEILRPTRRSKGKVDNVNPVAPAIERGLDPSLQIGPVSPVDEVGLHSKGLHPIEANCRASNNRGQSRGNRLVN